jgi:RimJ/RimL family protein N-acetyltransferase
MRPATPEERPAVLRFLQAHEATSMFPIGNLLGSGPATESWVFTTGGSITGFLGLTEFGNLLPQAPDADWQQARAALAGRSVTSLAGPPDQCHALQAALGLQEAPTRLHKIEPGYSLDLSQMTMPDCSGLHLTPIRKADLPLVTQWRAAALIETMGFTPEAAPAEALRQVLVWQKDNRHRILWRGETPLSLAGANAEIPQVLQVGGVYTPPALRNQGFARRAVALMLAEAQGRGIARALLFAASEAAARAYIALGFQRSHDFGLTMFRDPQGVA